jgi:hypothetical protein
MCGNHAVPTGDLGVAKDIGVLSDLLVKGPTASYPDDAKSLVLQRFPQRAIPQRGCMFGMVRTVNKDTNPGYAVSLVVEIGLNGDVSRRGVLRVIRKPQPIPIEKIKEASLETRRGVE